MEDHNTRVIVFCRDGAQARAVAEAIIGEAFHKAFHNVATLPASRGGERRSMPHGSRQPTGALSLGWSSGLQTVSPQESYSYGWCFAGGRVGAVAKFSGKGPVSVRRNVTISPISASCRVTAN